MTRGRGRVGGGPKQKFNNKRPSKIDLPSRRQYEEFGEAHPIDEKEVKIKRLKVEDTQEEDASIYGEEVASEESSSDDEQTTADPMARLMATFNTNTNKAIDSDEEEEEEDDDDDDGGGGEEEDECDGVNEEVSGDSDSSEDLDDVDDNHDGPTNAQSEEEDSSMDEQDYEGLEEEEKPVEDDEDDDEDKNDDDDDKSPHSQDDPFIQHFERNLNEESAEQVKDPKKWTSTFQKWPTLGRVKVEVPKVEASTSKLLLLASEDEDQTLPRIGSVPQPAGKNYKLDDYHVRKLLQRHLPTANVNGSKQTSSGLTPCSSSLTEVQKELLSVLSSYCDLYYPEATHERWEEVRTVYALHALNHVLKTRKRVVNHSAKLKKEQSDQKKGTSSSYRDQGYARPTVLILLPFKHSAYRLVETLVTLLFGDDGTPNVANLKRFREDYGPGETEGQEEGGEGQGRAKLSRPEDFQAIFHGDSDEDFKIGLKFSKNSMKIYADFYQSDIILASPLGLRYIMGTASRTDAETDFLSSIEILVIDQADIFLMQNWEHVLVVTEGVGQAPRDLQQLESDITRVRLWTLDGFTQLYRQTLVFASTLTDHNRAVVAKCTNFAGRLQVLNPVTNGSAEEVVVDSELVITRIPGQRDPDARFLHFTREVLPRLRSTPHRPGTMVYVPDYCDYVRLLRHLKQDMGLSVATINEYMVAQNSKVAKARSLFFSAKRHILLFTERFHFYRRYLIKGVRHIIFYSLPTYPHFFSEICNLMVEGNQNPRVSRDGGSGGHTVSALVQRSDLTQLIGVLGSTRAAQLINANKPVHICGLGK